MNTKPCHTCLWFETDYHENPNEYRGYIEIAHCDLEVVPYGLELPDECSKHEEYSVK